MATARRENFGKLLEPGLRKIFYEVYGMTPSMLGEIFNMQTTSNPYEEDVGIGTMGDFPEFHGTVEYDRPYQGYNKIYEFPEFAKGFRIERKLWDDDRYQIINKRPAGLATSAARRREKDGAKIFNEANTTAGFDGVALCHTEHPSKAFVDTGGAEGIEHRSNKSTLALNHANLRTVHLDMRQIQDDRGNRINVQGDTLLVHPDLEEKAWELIATQQKVDTAENNMSILYGKYKLILWDELTDPDAWFLIDTSYSKMFLNWFDRIPLEFDQEGEFDTFVAKFRAYMRYDCGWSDWIWLWGSSPNW